MNVQRTSENKIWTCDVCTEDIGPQISTTFDDTKVCSRCIQQIFKTSLSSENEFPPRWGCQVLDVWDFRHAVDTNFLRRFEKKADEYTCPPKERIYCHLTSSPRQPQQCGTFLGRRVDQKQCRQCEVCQWDTCMRCGVTCRTGNAKGKDPEHRCDPSIEEELRRRPFEGLKRGRDYQDCPNPRCERRIELSDGCNCITCRNCQTQFCYICGRKAADGSGHWKPGNPCPKWNQPDSENALFYRGHDHYRNEIDDLDHFGHADDGIALQMEMHRLRDGLVNRGLYPEPIRHANFPPVLEPYPMEPNEAPVHHNWTEGDRQPLRHDPPPPYEDFPRPPYPSQPRDLELLRDMRDPAMAEDIAALRALMANSLANLENSERGLVPGQEYPQFGLDTRDMLRWAEDVLTVDPHEPGRIQQHSDDAFWGMVAQIRQWRNEDIEGTYPWRDDYYDICERYMANLRGTWPIMKPIVEAQAGQTDAVARVVDLSNMIPRNVAVSERSRMREHGSLTLDIDGPVERASWSRLQ